jgi:phosphate transport system substrate-binding protein
VKALSVLAVLLAIAACATLATAAGQVLLNAAGATFPYPMYSKWFDVYHQAHPDVQINYQSIGSGGGIRQLIDKTVDFGASDGPMNDDQLKQASVPILHFPTVLGADVPSYNLPGVSAELNFTPEALGGIFLGKVTKWNDPAIASANPGVKLPSDDIVVVHRSDGSGTTYIWTDYLSKVSPEWLQKVGKATSVNWPVGLGGKGNEGVAGLVQQTPDSIGYIVSAAAAAASKAMPDDFRVSITNPEGNKDAYPIASFTWLLIPSKFTDTAKRDAVKDFLKWMMTDGQQYCEGLAYAKLPKEVVAKEMKAIAQIQ